MLVIGDAEINSNSLLVFDLLHNFINSGNVSFFIHCIQVILIVLLYFFFLRRGRGFTLYIKLYFKQSMYAVKATSSIMSSFSLLQKNLYAGWGYSWNILEKSAMGFELSSIFTKGLLDNTWLIIEATAVFIMIVLQRWKVCGNEVIELA